MSDFRQMAGQHDLGAERAVLGCVLLDNGGLNEVADILAPEDFYARQNATVWAAMLAMSGRQEQIDLVTLRSELAATGQLERAGGEDALMTIGEQLLTVHAIETYARRVRSLSTVRAMVRAAMGVVARSREPIEDVDAFLDLAEAELHGVAISRRADHRCRSLKSLAVEVFEDIIKRAEYGPVRGATTGITDLDRMLGGMRGSQLIVLAGRPGMGKTAFALHTMVNVARTHGPVLGWSGEMSSEEWAERTIVEESGIEGDVIRSGGRRGHGSGKESFSRNEMQRLMDSVSALDIPVDIDDTPAISLWQLRSKARRMKARGGLALIVVDYLQLMQSGERRQKREEEIAAISRGLKAIAKELGVPVMALSQLNRKVEERTDKRPGMADVRESGQIEQDADAILFLYRDAVYNDEAPATVAEVIVAKQRGGRTGTIKAFFDPAVMRWGDLAPDNRQPSSSGYSAGEDDFSDDIGGWG